MAGHRSIVLCALFISYRLWSFIFTGKNPRFPHNLRLRKHAGYSTAPDAAAPDTPGQLENKLSLDLANSTCFPHTTANSNYERKGQVNGPFGQALGDVARMASVRTVFEIGTWYGGGSTKFLADALQAKGRCHTNQTHHCCTHFMVTFEVFEPAWTYASSYLKSSPVWLVLGTTVSVRDMLGQNDIETESRFSNRIREEMMEHFRLYYERDRKIMSSQMPQLRSYCDRFSVDFLLIDGNEYTGWAEFQIAVQSCQPNFIALHDTGTLKTRHVEKYMSENSAMFPVYRKGDIWAVHHFKPESARLKVLSYALYGSNPRYTDGILRNIPIAAKIFPGWKIFLYMDDSVPEAVLEKLRPHVREGTLELHNMQGSPFSNRMAWRFLVAADKRVDYFAIRDSDSRISLREKAAVDEWVRSGKKFHVMRDHPSHSHFAMSGGLWGGVRGAFPNMRQEMLAFQGSDSYMQDMNFLSARVWPTARESLLQHDAFSCGKYGAAQPWPTPRNGVEHVGSVYLPGEKTREGDEAILRAALSKKC